VQKKEDGPAKASERAPKEGATPARVIHPVLEKVPERVEYITQLMADRVWNPDTSRTLQKEFSELWGVHTATIRSYSAEASRSLLDVVRERRAELAKKAVDTLIEVAESDCHMAGDKAAKVSASKILLEFAGVDRPDEDKIQKHVVAGVSEATPEKAREVIRGLFGDVTPNASADDLADTGQS
jgi:hypothetical protein